jgi:PAS domain S-box-containing protein
MFVALGTLIVFLPDPDMSMATNEDGGVGPDVRVVVIHSYHYGFTWSDSISEGVQAVFRESAREAEIKFEFLDTRFNSSGLYLRGIAKALKVKYEHHKVDVVIASDDHALNFMLTHGRRIFSGVPVVFCSVSGYKPEMRGLLKLTGLMESIDIRSTIETALRLHPDTEEIAVILDKSRTGQALKKKTEEALGSFADRIKIRYLEDLTVEQLKHELPKLNKKTVVILFIFRPDETGRVLSHEQNLLRLRPYCPFPIYAVWQFYLGHGIVGGKLTNGFEEGRMAARMALRIIKGEDAADIPLEVSPVEYMFDHLELERFGIEPEALPQNSILINKPFSFYETNKTLIWVVVVTFLAMISIITALIVNIAARKSAEKTLRESEEKYRLLADNVSDNIWVLDLDTLRISYISPSIEGITGYSAQEVMGLRLKDVLTPSSLNVATQVLTEELSLADSNADPSRSRTLELENYHKDGSIIWVEASMRFIYDENGQLVSILGVTRDISDRKRLQNQLQKAQKMESLGLMAGGIAHDLNNILSGIVSYPDLLLLDLPEESPFREPIETIKESGDRAAEIVADLLTVARGVTISKEPLNLNKIVQEYTDSAEQRKLEKKHPMIKLRKVFDPEILDINCSPAHIKKSIMNLVINAYEAIEDHGTVTITTMNRYLDEPLKGYEYVKKGEYVMLTVSDDGSGISVKDLERVFEPFYTTKVMGRSGTGLGLAVVWNTIQDHDGYINVETGINGTVFELYFPARREDLFVEKEDVTPTDYMGHGEKILVIDDESNQRKIACGLLKRLNYSAEAVSNGEAAVEYVKEQVVDLILLDMIMPKGMNGRETYEAIIKIRPGQKAIITSGFSETEDVKATQRLGAGKYVKKPYSLEKIGLAVKAELEK